MLVFFTKLSLVEFLVRILVLFLFFSIIGCFLCFWVVYIFETVLLMLLVLKDSFVAPCFSCNVLMIFHVIYNIALNADNLISASSVVVILICHKILNRFRIWLWSFDIMEWSMNLWKNWIWNMLGITACEKGMLLLLS